MLRSRPEVGEVARQVAAPRLGLLDHRREAVRLVAEVLDLAIDGGRLSREAIVEMILVAVESVGTADPSR